MFQLKIMVVLLGLFMRSDLMMMNLKASAFFAKGNNEMYEFHATLEGNENAAMVLFQLFF